MKHNIVYDMSHWNDDAYFTIHKKDPLIIKCSNGTNGIDDKFEKRLDKATNIIGCYDYGYAGTNFKKMGENARDHYNGIHWLDIESEYFDGKKPTRTQLLNDIVGFFGTTDPRKWYIYSGYAKYKKWFKGQSDYNGAHFWIAKYPTSKVIDDVQMWLDSHKHPEIDKDHVLMGWQFTSTGGDRSEWYYPVTEDDCFDNPYPIPRRTLKKTTPTMKGDDVKWLQWALGIEIDGSFGKLTLKAVKEYQERNGLEADGKVGPKTRATLLSTMI